jgi:hypothetical protein
MLCLSANICAAKIFALWPFTLTNKSIGILKVKVQLKDELAFLLFHVNH